MRVVIPPTSASGGQTPVTKILDTGGRKANVKVQFFDPVTYYWSRIENDLYVVDAVGNPQRGFQFTQSIVDFLAFRGAMYVACNQQTQVEVSAWDVETGQTIL